MRFLRSLPRLLAALLVFVSVAGCDRADSGQSPTGPQQLLGLNSLSGYTIANDPIVPRLLDQPLSIAAWVGKEGGTLTILGHTLTVPAGSVLQPTLFTMQVLPSGQVELHFTALAESLLGRILNVGTQGFEKPVVVTLTYERSTNISDPTKLIVLREKGLFGRPEPLPSRVDLENKTVTARLDHFSRYFVALPN